MSTNTNIEHDGIIDHIDDGYIYVKILSQSACAACHAKSLCNASEMVDKIIEVKRLPSYIPEVGKEVTLVMRESLGFTALILGYLLPFVILMTTLILMMFFFNNELLSGLVSLAVLVPYYIVLFLNKNRLRNKFEFKIKGQ